MGFSGTPCPRVNTTPSLTRLPRPKGASTRMPTAMSVPWGIR